MIIQVVIAIILILLALTFIKFDHHAKRIKFIVLAIVALLLYLSISGVFSSDEVDVSSPKGIVNGIYVYFGWLGRTAGNLWDIGTSTVKTVGNAIKINNTETPKR